MFPGAIFFSYKGECMKTFLCCIAEKYTRNQITNIVEVKAGDAHEAIPVLEKMFQIKVNGWDNYLDFVQVD